MPCRYFAAESDLDVHVIAGLVLIERLDELLIHPGVELAHSGTKYC